MSTIATFKPYDKSSENEQHAGERVTVNPMAPKEYDLEGVGRVFEITFSDGTSGEAFEDELSDWTNCSCAHYADGSTNTSMCSLHADRDPCLTTSLVTGKRRKGTIRGGTCTACGWTERRG